MSHFSARSGTGVKLALSYLTSWLKRTLLTIRFWTAPIGGQGVMLALTGSLKVPPLRATGFGASAAGFASAGEAVGWAAGWPFAASAGAAVGAGAAGAQAARSPAAVPRRAARRRKARRFIRS